MASIIIAAQGAHELKELGRKFKEYDRADLRRLMRKRIKAAGKPVVADLRRAVMGVTITRGNDPYIRRTEETGVAPRRSTDRWGRRSSGLRARTARAIGISQTRKGIRILVSPRKFGDYGVTMPRRLDASIPKYRKLRHPVFGNREVWVEHIGDPWFFVTIYKHRARFEKAVDAAIDEMKRELER